MSGPTRPLSWLLSLPTALLVASVCAVPAHADPPTDPGSRGEANSSERRPTAPPSPENRPPLPPQAKVPDSVPNNGNGNGRGNGNGNADAPGRPAEAPPAGGGAGSDQAPPPQAQSDVRPSRKVVVCKYVQTPGDGEVYSHVIVVSANALVGKGFDGTFPHPFSDGQLNSVAIRYAEKGESAREVGDAACPATSVVPGGPGTGGDTGGDAGDVGGEVEESPQVAGLVESADGGAAAEGEAAADADGFLPATGSSAMLAWLAGLGGLATAGGLAMLAYSRRKQAGSTLG